MSFAHRCKDIFTAVSFAVATSCALVIARAEPAAAASPSPARSGLAPFEQRLQAAKSVKVMTAILGVEVGASVADAHAKLDSLSEGGKPTKEEDEEEEGEAGTRKILWQFVATDFSGLFVKANEEGRITNITAFLRPGKELPFASIGDVKKAPLQNANGIAWDVVRPNHPLFRVVAEGARSKAKTISIFLVKRPKTDERKSGRDATAPSDNRR